MKAFWLIATLALLLQQAPQVAQVTNPPAPPAQLGAIQGTVNRLGTSDPIVGAQITVSGGPVLTQTMDVGGRLLAVSSGGTNTLTAVSDASGRFTFANVPAGAYTVRVQSDTYVGAPPNGSAPSGTANVVVVGQSVSVALAMVPGAVVSGRVRDSSGQPISNAAVNAYSVSYRDGMPTIQSVISRSTDDRGDYEMFWVPPGEYYIGVTPLPPGPGAIAAKKPQNVRTFYPGVAELAGTQPTTIRSGEKLEGMDISVQTLRPSKVSGQVTSTVVIPPAQAAAVAAAAARGALSAIAQINVPTVRLVSRDVMAPDSPSAQTATVVMNGSVGQFEIQNVLPGSYDLYAQVRTDYARISVDVRGQDLLDLSIVVVPSGSVKGTVVGPIPPAPAPAGLTTSTPNVASTVVRIALQPEGTLAKVSSGQRQGVVVADGSFTITVPEGHFRVAFVNMPANQYIDDVRQNGVSVYNAGIDVGVETPPFEVIVKSGTAIIQGVAEDAQQKVRPGAVVALVPSAGRENRARYYSATADPTGAFTIRGIAPGDYKLFAWESLPGDAYLNPAFLAKHESSGRPVTVAPNATMSERVSVISQ